MAEIDLEKLEDSTHLLDILVGLENILDSLDIYVFSNWVDGDVVEGPIVRRHWVTFSLLYPYHKMPDPRAALRLLKHGVQVEFDKVKQEEDATPIAKAQEPAQPSNWIVRITVPRRLLDTAEEVDLDIYDDEVNPEDVTAAKDVGLDNESQYQADEQLPPEGEQPMQPPMPQQGNPPPPR